MYPGNFSRLAIGSNSATRVCTETEPGDAGDLFAPAVGGHGMGWARGCVSSSPAQLLAVYTPRHIAAGDRTQGVMGAAVQRHQQPPLLRPIVDGGPHHTPPLHHAQHSTHVGPSSGGDGTGRNLSAQHVRPCRFVHALIATARLVSVVTAMPPPRPSHPASAAHGRHMDARALAPCRHVTPWCRPAGPWAVQASATCAQQRGRVRDCHASAAARQGPSRPVPSSRPPARAGFCCPASATRRPAGRPVGGVSAAESDPP